MRWGDIPMLTECGHYEVNTSISDLPDTIARYQDGGEAHADLDLLPDFQRGHVWTEKQQIAFVEFFMRGGMSGWVIYLNCPNWGSFYHIPAGEYRDFVIVDGLQRLTALMKFSRGELPIFDHYRLPKGQEPVPGRLYFEAESMRRARADNNLLININNLKSKTAVLKWYLEMNEGGTPHTEQELDKVREMIRKGE